MALRCCDLDLGRSLIRVERSWDREEGAIDPKSESSRRTVPLLAILRDYLDEHLLHTGREGEDLLFGRSATIPFAPMAIGKRAKRSRSKANEAEREGADEDGRRADLLKPITLARVPSHVRLTADRRRRQSEGDPGIHGSL